MVHSPACERARTWASLRLDGELSELERALLDAHLGRCAECSAAVEQIELITETVRSVPLEPVSGRFALPVARVATPRRFVLAAAAVFALALTATGLGSFAALHVVGDSQASPDLHRVSAVASVMSDDAELLAAFRTPPRVVRPVPGKITWPA